MKLILLLVSVATCSVFTCYSQSIEHLRTGDDAEPHVDMFTCRNKDSDALFPSGSFSLQCKRMLDGTALGYRYAPPHPGVRPTGNNRAFVLIEPMVYTLGSTSYRIEVPAGFVTDYASIPRPLWSLYSPHDQYSRAAVVHDYLYWSQLCKKSQADNIFMIAMKESEVSAATRDAVYAGVVAGGGSSWDANRDERKANMPRVVPVERKDFPPNWSWEMYRSYLIKKGVRDPVFSGNSYCVLGNSTEVPTGDGSPNKESAFSIESFVVRALAGMDEVVFNRGPE